MRIPDSQRELHIICASDRQAKFGEPDHRGHKLHRDMRPSTAAPDSIFHCVTWVPNDSRRDVRKPYRQRKAAIRIIQQPHLAEL